MSITKEWRIYDEADPRTHPEDIAHVEIELIDGNIFRVVYLQNAGLFSSVGGTRIIGTIKRWRYTSETSIVS